MRLNLPVLDDLLTCKNLLIAGMGGGFDLFCGLPIYFELRSRGQTVHLANYSFSDLTLMPMQAQLSDTLFRVDADDTPFWGYFPEMYLARWFQEVRGEAVSIWCFEKTGVAPLLEAYRALVKHLSIDGILLIDGGVDSLMHGDEPQMGTIIEDSVSLCAVNQLTEVPLRMTAAIGFGAERDMSHYHVFENIAGLSKSDHFLGTCSLVRQMDVYRQYDAAVSYVHSVAWQEPSVINSSIMSAVRGEFGDFHLTEKTRNSRLWISPLMPIYWFFDLAGVAAHNRLLEALQATEDFSDAMHQVFYHLQGRGTRQPERIPLT